MKIFSFSYLALFLLLSCSNYSTNKIKTVPPTLVSITASNGGYILKIRANNPEVFFLGYRLYMGTTESEARNPADLSSGANCVNGLRTIPNQPIEYSMEINSDPNINSGTMCKFQVNVQSGQYISIRGLLLSINLSNASDSVSPSQPSNAIIVP
ncbi:MAG: hypothetical protein H7A25_26530 [Leptospiraceae bacterium]|nr:hypothetical protein [Leptospiraceae bacterium]MCP5503484.1 hypothetical protein [Leptospiraceae bacterium]